MKDLEFKTREIIFIEYNYRCIGHIEYRGDYEITIYKDYTVTGGKLNINGCKTLKAAQEILTSGFLEANIIHNIN